MNQSNKCNIEYKVIVSVVNNVSWDTSCIKIKKVLFLVNYIKNIYGMSHSY
jgi:hypothetical protein